MKISVTFNRDLALISFQTTGPLTTQRIIIFFLAWQQLGLKLRKLLPYASFKILTYSTHHKKPFVTVQEAISWPF